MPRRSPNIRWEQSDGRFRVAVYERQDRDSFRVEFGQRGDRPASQTHGELNEAVKVAQGLWSAYIAGAIDLPTVAPRLVTELAELVAEQPDLAPKTKKGYRQTWEQFCEAIGDREIKRLSQIDVRLFLSRYQGATRDRYLRELRAGFNLAVRERWISDNPCAGEKQTHKRVMGPFLPVYEWPAYLGACTAAHRIRSEAVLESGLRAGELAACRLDWIHGLVGQKAVKIATDSRGAGFVPKWGMARAVPLTKRGVRVFEEAIEHWGARDGHDFVFSATGLAALGNLSADTREAVARAGCTPTTFHGLRRSYGAAMLERGVSMHELSRLLGHTDERTTSQWYAGMTDRHLGAVVARADEQRESKVTPLRRGRRAG